MKCIWNTMKKKLAEFDNLINKIINNKTFLLCVIITVAFFIIGTWGNQNASITLILLELFLIFIFLDLSKLRNKIIVIISICAIAVLIYLQFSKTISKEVVDEYTLIICSTLTLILIMMDTINDPEKHEYRTNLQMWRLVLAGIFIVILIGNYFANLLKPLQLWSISAYLIYFIPLATPNNKSEFKYIEFVETNSEIVINKNNSINKIKSIINKIKDKFKKKNLRLFLEKIDFTKVTIVWGITFVVTIILIILDTNKLTWWTLFNIEIVIGAIFYLLFTLKQIIDDIGKIVIFMIFLGWAVISIATVGKLMVKYIPKEFPENTSEIFELFTSSFTTFIASSIGVLGTYFGAVYGGKKSLEGVEKQLKKQEEEYNNKKNEDKEMVIRIITKFLKEEIIDNNLCIERTSLYEYIKRGHGVQYGYGGIKQGIKLDSYEKIKYELIKYPNEDLVESVIDLYELFYLLLRYDDLKEFDKKEFKKIATIKLKTNEVLKKIGYEV